MPEHCLQSLIWKEKLTLLIPSGLIVTIFFFIWYLNSVQTLPTNLQRSDIETLMNFGLQRQLFWGVVALTSFIGFFQYLAMVDRRESFVWLHKIFFWGFEAAITLSLTKIAEHLAWVARLEKQGSIIISKYGEFIHSIIESPLFPWLVGVACFALWFAFLCLFIDRITRSPPSKEEHE